MVSFTFLQTFFIYAMILMVTGMFVSMLLLTWALMRPKSIISTRTAGMWIMIFLIGGTACYMLLTILSR